MIPVNGIGLEILLAHGISSVFNTARNFAQMKSFGLVVFTKSIMEAEQRSFALTLPHILDVSVYVWAERTRMKKTTYPQKRRTVSWRFIDLALGARNLTIWNPIVLVNDFCYVAWRCPQALSRNNSFQKCLICCFLKLFWLFWHNSSLTFSKIRKTLLEAPWQLNNLSYCSYRYALLPDLEFKPVH